MNNAGIINGIEGYPFMTQQYYNNPNAHQEMNIGSSHAAGYMVNNSNGQFIMGSSSPSASAVGVAVNNLNSDLPAPTMKEYTLLNISNRRSTTGRKKSYNNNFNDPNKQCSNYNCRTSCTPMWRKGPLGLNTLCNSCGIKYRKEWKRNQDHEQEMMKKLQEGRGGTSDDAQDND
ncbi:GATA transcription factor 5-like [Tripterygium wilfordii]|nr:GATA transcription factor 5-like [Tripterygium wilfordii]